MPRAQGCAGAALSRLVSLIPKPRVNLTRFHGVFAPNSKHRVHITPANRGKVSQTRSLETNQTPAEQRAAMTWPLSHIPVLRGTASFAPNLEIGLT